MKTSNNFRREFQAQGFGFAPVPITTRQPLVLSVVIAALLLATAVVGYQAWNLHVSKPGVGTIEDSDRLGMMSLSG